MRLPVFLTTLLLGTLPALPMQALSDDASANHPIATAVTSDSAPHHWVAKRPITIPQAQPQSQSQSSPSLPNRRAQPSTPPPPPKATVQRSQPKPDQPSNARRTSPSQTSESVQAKPQTPTPAVQRPKPVVTRTPAIADPGVRSVSPRSRQTGKPQVQSPSVVNVPNPQKLQVSPKPVTKPVAQPATKPATKPVTSGIATPRTVPPAPATQPPKPAVTRDKIRTGVGFQPGKVQTTPIIRSKTQSPVQRTIRRQQYDSNRYWGSRLLQTRRLTSAYRPCYYCPGIGWSYSPTCYTRPNRYYIFSDSWSYWPRSSTFSSTTYVTRSRGASTTQSSLNQELIEQVEIAIQDYAELYDLENLNEDIQVSQEGSIIILTGVVDREETLEDLIAIARDIDGVKYVITDDVIVRELQDQGRFEGEPLNLESDSTEADLILDEAVNPERNSDFPPILQEDGFQEQLETALPDLELVATIAEFLP